MAIFSALEDYAHDRVSVGSSRDEPSWNIANVVLLSALPEAWAKSIAGMLCCLLVLFSAATMSAGLVDQFQHQAGTPIEHSHMLLNELSMVADQDDGCADGDGDSGSPDHQTGHHHHNDGGAALAILQSDDSSVPTLARSQPAFSLATLARAEPTAGPERPPKLSRPTVT